jgi:hypothetical protein
MGSRPRLHTHRRELSTEYTRRMTVLRKCRGGLPVRAVESEHPLDVAFRVPLFFGQFVMEFSGQPRDHGGPPPFPPLPLIDHPADVPVETDQQFPAT